MKMQGTMCINPKGHLQIGGCDTVDLATEFGTPLYVMDEQTIIENCRAYVQAFAAYYPQAEVLYASKVFSTIAMCELIKNQGMGLDVVSGGELFTAVKAEFPASKIYFHGNNKSMEELSMAMDVQVGRIVVDNFYELEVLNEVAKQHRQVANILLRVSPGIDAHTHSYIKTGMIDSKFGLGIVNGQAAAALNKALQLKNIEVKGIHCHIGSQIFDLHSYVEAVHTMMAFAKTMKNTTGYEVQELNIGGGLGIYYTEEDNPQPIEVLVRLVAEAVQESARQYRLALPKIIVEPGRSIVGQAGITLYTIGSVKEIPGIRKYIAVDGGMTDNPRPALYQARYEAVIANKMVAAPTELVSIAGKCCESGDMLIWDIELPQAEPGDLLAVFSTGAYNYSMASNYNRNLKPAVIFVENGKPKLVVKRETYEDIVRNDIMI